MTQAMVDECCAISQRTASTYLHLPPQEYFQQRCDLAKHVSDDLQGLSQRLHFDITHKECRSFGAIIAAWPNTGLFNKSLLTFRYEYTQSNQQPHLFLTPIKDYIATLQITRTRLDGLLTACLIAFTCCVGDVYLHSLDKASNL